MNVKLAEEIVACLMRGERTKYYYFKDRYALAMLWHYCRDGMRVGALRQSRLGRLLSKPLVRQVLSQCGDGVVRPENLASYWPERFHCYTLSLGLWGSARSSCWYQTSRAGYNLVLQLNFSNLHDRHYRRLKLDTDCSPFDFACHPTSRVRNTLAWSRIDLDLESDTALIEEVQNDWLREARELYEQAKQCLEAKGSRRSGRRWYESFPPERAVDYFEMAIEPHLGLWSEAMLSATIEFLLEEIGVGKIFYHSWETGCKVKNCRPPRSVYSSLPEKFCFQRVSRGPQFLYDDRSSRRKMRKIQNQNWYLLDFKEREDAYEKEQAA
ncbi:hypothetical protein [Microbulbifer rhizosphaerae]|uniref:Uncharacterized protein n=1 Tax=Microbulbifer rhizosphaerae TaxID=1562603 RepID=A0A7W4W9Z7_9GAMM|nr:hypothetical protein [Microbulbifer rhizosphaerae]MBB3060423.1 hypothetical protein [Microbulbifer rhizosphaerae]